jgi:hypothetical protein
MDKARFYLTPLGGVWAYEVWNQLWETVFRKCLHRTNGVGPTAFLILNPGQGSLWFLENALTGILYDLLFAPFFLQKIDICDQLK